MQKSLLLIFLFVCNNALCQNDSIKTDNLRKEINQLTLSRDFKLAALKYTEMIAENPDDLRLLRDRGITYIASGNYIDAIPDFTKLIDSDYKSLGEAYFYRALCKVVTADLPCDDFLKSKLLGYKTDYSKFQLICPTLNNN